MSETTPRHGHEPIAMRRVPGPNDVDAVGEFAIKGDRIMIAVPWPNANAPDNYVQSYIPITTGPRSPGFWGWDGNEDAPTLTPSLHVIGHWHGWVRAGMLVEA